MDNPLIFDIEIEGKPYHIEISSPFGMGNISWHIMINNYYYGSFVTRPWGLHPYMNKGCILYGDDLQVILDMINGQDQERLPNLSSTS
jgi:hypothetical protein